MMTQPIRRRKSLHIEEEIDSDGSWAVSYGDMVTLLLTFFIVFFTIDPKSSKSINQRLQISLVDILKATSSNEVYQGVTNEMALGKQQKPGIDKEILKQWGGIAHDQGHYVIIEFPGVSFFNSAQTNLTTSGAKALADFVRVYMPFAGNYEISIRAFADYRQVRKNSVRFQDNLELTALRSVSAMRILQKAGIPLNRIKVGGYGEMVTTARELELIPKERRSSTDQLDLARKVVLIVEQEAKK